MVTSGRFLDGTMAWIKAQLDEASQLGLRVIGMMHHGVVEHFDKQSLIFPEFLVDNRDAVAGMFSNGGMGVVFTGHFHANDITRGTPSGGARSIYDVETGSTVTYPCPYRIVNLASDTLTITTKHVTTIDYDLRGATDFQSYAHDDLRVGLASLIASLIEAPPYSIATSEAATLSPWLGDGLVAHYAGDEFYTTAAQSEAQSLMSSAGLVEQLAGTMLQSIYTDLPPADNVVTIDLSTR